jgi:large subunit ribosomal protein L9
MNIEVVLTQDDEKLGKRGEVVKVSPGYAQNFLFPGGKAKLATPANLKSFEREKEKFLKDKLDAKEKALELSQKLSKITLTMEVAVGEGDKLYGAVTSQELRQALLGKAICLEKRHIHLEEPIRKLGNYEVSVKLHPEVSALLKVLVTKKK